MLGTRLCCLLALAAMLLAPAPVAHAQPSEEGDHVELPPGHPDANAGSYAWEAGGGVDPSLPTPATHRFARLFLSVGVGITFRTLIYVDTLGHDPGGLAPLYLQLRGAYFFEGDGDFQHGIGLGIASNLGDDPPGSVFEGGTPSVVNQVECDRLRSVGAGDGSEACTPAGIALMTAWTLVPGYHVRFWLDDWFQLAGRIGFGVTAAELPNVGFELGVGAIAKIFAGLGLYAEVSFSTYFAAETHPLVSLEGGVVIDYELLP